MKRTLLALLGVMLLSVAGSLFAQSEYGSSDSTASDQPAATTASDSQDSTAGTVTGSSGSSGSAAQGSMADPSSSSSPQHRSLPKTASSDPLALALGLTALASAVGLHIYQRRKAH